MLARGWVVGYSDEMNFNLTKNRRLPEALSLSALLRCARGAVSYHLCNLCNFRHPAP